MRGVSLLSPAIAGRSDEQVHRSQQKASSKQQKAGEKTLESCILVFFFKLNYPFIGTLRQIQRQSSDSEDNCTEE